MPAEGGADHKMDRENHQNAGRRVTVGVILAAGMSTRMGEFKPLLPLKDTTFIKRIIHMMKEAGIERIEVVAGAKYNELAEHLKDEKVELLYNSQYRTTQMLESVKLAILEAQRSADAILLTPVDVPLPDAAIYRAILQNPGNADCVRPSYHGRAGHPVLIEKRIFPAILSYNGRDGLRGALKDAGADIAWIDVNDPSVVMDADTPEDYQDLLKQLQRGKEYIAVAGGLNVDIGGSSLAPLIPHDSNPGNVTITSGGVGRNIAHNLALLGQRVFLLTAYGNDQYRDMIEKEAAVAGYDLTDALRLNDVGTAVYLFLNEPDGNMAMAVNDMKICERLDPAYFEKHLDAINAATLFVMDANLPEASIEYLTEHVTVPIFADMVSTTKAKRFLPYLSKLHTIKPNMLEAEVLSGIKITDGESAQNAAAKLCEMGVRQVFLSLGTHGMIARTADEMVMIEAYPAKAVNMSGAGDASLAALAVSHLFEKDLKGSAEYANAAASIAVESLTTVSEKMSLEEVKTRVQKMHEIKEG